MTTAVNIQFHGSERTSGPQDVIRDAADHLRLTIAVNGVAATAILDSGAARSILDPRFLARTVLSATSGFTAVGITGHQEGSVAQNAALRVGDLSASNLPVGILDLSALSRGQDAPVDAILGWDVLKALPFDLDFNSMTLTLTDRPPPLFVAGSAPVRLDQTTRGTPFFEMSIGHRRQNAAFDLGYNATLLLSPDQAMALSLFDGRPWSTVLSQGVNGASISRVTTVEEIEIGGLVLRNVPVETPSSWTRPIEAVVGFEILRRFRIWADYPRRLIRFQPRADLVGTPLPRDRSGIGARFVGIGLQVAHVAPGSPAETAGLLVGDLIVQIDGAPMSLAFLQANPKMGERASGHRQLLTLADGRNISLTLRDYY